MKTTILLTFIIACSAVAQSQKSINWGPEIAVADGSFYGNVRPRLALAEDAVPLVVFGHANQGKLYVARYNGSGFNTPVGITPQAMQAYLANWTGPDMATYGDTVVVVFKAKPLTTGHIYAVHSFDGGNTFSDTIRVDEHEIGRTFLPALDADESGNFALSYMTFDNFSELNPQYVVTHTADAGQTFETAQPVSTINGAEACDCCPSEMLVNGNSEVLLYRNNDINVRDIYGVLSTDNGQNFTIGNNLEDLNWNLNACPSTGPHGCTVNNTLVVAAASEASGNYRVYISTASWSDLQTQGQYQLMPPDNPTGKQNYPRISAAGDTVVVVWEERETSNPDVFCAVVTDGNLAGLDDYKARINITTTATQTNPDVVVKNGTVHVVYQDAASGNVIYRAGTIVDVVGVNDWSISAASISPNPSSDGLFVLNGVHDPAHLRLTDVSGKSVDFSLSGGNQTYSLALKHPEKGMYFLSTGDQSGAALRLIVQ